MDNCLSWSGFSTIMSTTSSCQPHHHVNHPSSSSWEVWQLGSVWIQGWKRPRARNLVFFPFCTQEAFFYFRKSSHLQPLEQPLVASSKIVNSSRGTFFTGEFSKHSPVEGAGKVWLSSGGSQVAASGCTVQVAVQVAALGKWLQVAALGKWLQVAPSGCS